MWWTRAALLLFVLGLLAPPRTHARRVLMDMSAHGAFPRAPPNAPACAGPDPSSWYNLRNDTCRCPWNCIDCNGGTRQVLLGSGAPPEDPRTCVCPARTASLDCQGCTNACPCSAGQTCVTSVLAGAAASKTYVCSNLVGASYVWTARAAAGTATLTAYQAPSSTPVLFSCALSGCLSFPSGASNSSQTFQCSTTVCESGLQNATLISGPTSDGSATLLVSGSAPLTLVGCNASGCSVPPPPTCTTPVPPQCVSSSDPATWLMLRNDTCQCPWDCIQCHGNGRPEAVPNGNGRRTCLCNPGTATMDCLGCTSDGCPVKGSECDTTVFVTGTKAYSCIPDAELATFFEGGGLFTWSVVFPDPETPSNGSVVLNVYADPTRTPLLFECQLADCQRTIRDGNQEIKCEKTVCVPIDERDAALANVIRSLSGTSSVILSPNGRAQMFQQQVAITIQMQCSGSGCRFPGEGAVKQSTLEVALASTFGALILAAIIGLIAFCVWRSRVLARNYLNFGQQRFERALEWEHLACTLRFRLPAKRLLHKGEMRTLQVLKPMSGEARPGTMTAIMGESGAGKTALLDMLARRKTFGALEGQVLVNNHVPGAEWRRVTGYVLQDDVFIATQTAREHLTFAANMKLPSIMSPTERAERVEALLTQMSLSHVGDSLIGDSTHKGLSGGEKKRLSIATELVANPSIVFVDEPTSGLDSVNSYRVMRCLQDLARDHGKTVIFSIHSPDARLFDLFDQVLILAKGYLMYSGPRGGLQPAMEAIAGAPCPPHYNPADFAIHTIATITDQDELRRLSAARVDKPVVGRSSDLDLTFKQSSVELVEMTPAAASPSSDKGRDSSDASSAVLIDDGDRVSSDELGPYSQPWLWQVAWTCLRSLTDAWRNPYLLRLQYVLIVGAALVLGGLFFQMTLTEQGAQNRLGLLFFVCILLMVVTLPSIDTFYAERAVFLREKAAGYYSASAYFMAKALADVVPLRLIPPIVLTLIMYPMTGLRLQSATYLFWFMLIVILLSYCATGLCFLISSLAPSVSVGNLAAILVMLFELLFGGLLLSTSSLPSGIAWLRWVSFIFYAYNALMVSEFTNLTFYVDAGAAGVVPLNGQFFLTFFGLEPSAFYLCIYLLILQGTLFYFLSGVALFLRKEKR